MPFHAGDLPPAARELALASLGWMERRCDPATGLFRLPGDRAGRVRESVWLAQGLLLRNSDGDRTRAAAILEHAIDRQIHARGAAWDGTFARTSDEPAPRRGARPWIDYDPNWRQFLAAAFSLILREHASLLPAPLARRMQGAVKRAVEGEPPERISARYTNIALLHSWLLVEAQEPRGLELARQIADAFESSGAFAEYGSPTYYGVDLYALALWRVHSSSGELRALGDKLWAALWRDVADFYHADLRNLAGPFTRSYGMDLRRYASLLGLWIWAAVGRRNAPFPSLDSPFDHAHDIALAPSVALLSARLEPLVTDDVQRHLESFQGERLLSRSLSEQPRRRASAWLGEGLAIGAESSEVDWHGYAQYHPATVHWRAPGTPSADVGWLRLRHDGSVLARAEPGALVLDLPEPLGRPNGDTRFEIFAPGLRAEDLASAIGRSRWRLPGLDIRVATEAQPTQLKTTGAIHTVSYAGGPKRFRLEFGLA